MAQIQQWFLHQTSFSNGKGVWPREYSVLDGFVSLALLGDEELVLGWGSGLQEVLAARFP